MVLLQELHETSVAPALGLSFLWQLLHTAYMLTDALRIVGQHITG